MVPSQMVPRSSLSCILSTNLMTPLGRATNPYVIVISTSTALRIPISNMNNYINIELGSNCPALPFNKNDPIKLKQYGGLGGIDERLKACVLNEMYFLLLTLFFLFLSCYKPLCLRKRSLFCSLLHEKRTYIWICQSVNPSRCDLFWVSMYRPAMVHSSVFGTYSAYPQKIPNMKNLKSTKTLE